MAVNLISSDDISVVQSGNDITLEIEDTGWVDMSAYINTTYFTARPGYKPYARRIGKVVYWIGEVYCTTAVGSQVANLLTGIPNEFRPTYQFAGSGCRYSTSDVYNMFVVGGGNITISSGSNIGTTADFLGYQLSNIGGYLVD